MLQQFYSETLDLAEAFNLTADVINQVSQVDSAVGPFEGESWLFGLKDGKPYLGGLDVDSKFFKGIKQRSNWRQELLKYVWKESTFIGEKKLQRIIKKAIKNWEKEEKKKSK